MSKFNPYISILFAAIFLVSLVSCEYFQPSSSKTSLARVGSKILYLEEIDFSDKEFESKEDSLLFLQREIDNWALERLLVEKAKFNLTQEQQKEFDEMAAKYRVELYSKAYRDALIEKRIQASFSDEDIVNYYEANKHNFRLNETLLQLRYLQINPNLNDIDEIKNRFKSFTEEDKSFLDNRKLEYKNYQANDSVWLRARNVFKDIHLIGQKISSEEFIQQKEYFEISDSTDLYLIKINKVLLPNDEAPMSYIKPTIEQILTNRLKFEVGKDIEKEILKDGIKNNEYEIFP